MRVRLLLLTVLALLAGSSCAQSSRIRFMTYNIEWFSEGANLQRINRISNILRTIKPDVVALQEVQSRKALDQLFNDEWTVATQDEADEDQELALAVRKPLRVETFGNLFRAPELDVAFPGKRDVLRAIIATPEGEKFSVYVLHNKSRGGGRLATDPQRQMAMGMLATWIANHPNEQHVVLGDLNDGPDDVSVNILESGNLRAKGGRVQTQNPLMVNIMEPLYDQDVVTHGLHQLFKGGALEPIVKGAKNENERWRGKEYRYPDDVLVEQIMFDQILLSPALAARAGKPMVYAGIDALAGEPGRTRKDEKGRAVYEVKPTRASDHLPVFVDIDRRKG